MDDLIGRQLDGYVIESVVGRGGMARVYRARQARLERICALKILRPELADDEGFVQRFLREARSAASLEHPHIVPIYDTGAMDGYYFISMKYLSGLSLRQLLDRGRLPLELVPRLITQAAAALDYAHSRGVVHRDIKPGNIVVDERGWLTLTDFGLARAIDDLGLTATGTLLGTPLYMAPEQVQGRPATARTDIYQLGTVTYEMLCGATPFGERNTQAILFAQLTETAPPVHERAGELDPAISNVVQRAVEKDPELRYPTAGEFARELAAAVAGLEERRGAAGLRRVPPPEPPTIFEEPDSSFVRLTDPEKSTVRREPGVAAAAGAAASLTPPETLSEPQPAAFPSDPAPERTMAVPLASAAAASVAGATPEAHIAGAQTVAEPVGVTHSGAGGPPAVSRTGLAVGGCSWIWLLALGGVALAFVFMAGAGFIAYRALGDDDPTATPTQSQTGFGTAADDPTPTSAGPTATSGPGTATDEPTASATTPDTATPTATDLPPTDTPTATPLPPTATIEPPPATTALLAENLVAGWSPFNGDWGESFPQGNTYITRVNPAFTGRIFFSGDTYASATQAIATVRFLQFDPSSFACLWMRYATEQDGALQSGYRLCVTAQGGVFADWLRTTNAWTDFEQTTATLQSPPALDPNQPATLSIVGQGGRLWFLVNGGLVGLFAHDGATEGRLAFEIAHDVDVGLLEVEFSEVHVWSVE